MPGTQTTKPVTYHLAWDMSRCRGLGCSVRSKCLRHTELNNMGPRTPVTDHLCSDEHSYYHPSKEPSYDTDPTSGS